MRKNYIAGEWRTSAASTENTNPSDTRDMIDLYARADIQDVEDAVAAARQAFSSWSRSSPLQRFECLDAIGTEIIARKHELGDMLAREEGKILKEATAEAHRAGHLFKFFAAQAYSPDTDGYRSLRDGVELEVRRQPIGVVGGDRPETGQPGHYLAPALFVGTSNRMRLNREEIFGPIATVIAVANYDEALAVANDADYGLSAGIITRDVSIQRHFVNNIEAGMAQVNLPTAGMDFHAPFTGKKGSSFGPPEKGIYCREFFTGVKVVHAAIS